MMIVTQNLIDKLTEWQAKGNAFRADFLPVEFSEKHCPDWLQARHFEPIGDINILEELLDLGDIYITILAGLDSAEIKNENEDFDAVIEIVKEEDRQRRAMQVEIKLMGVA